MARILVINDDDQISGLVLQMLSESGHEVGEASDGHVGLDQFPQTPTDLVITDILMPERDGLEIIQTLKKENPEVKIIAVSGGGDTGRIDYLSQAEDFGADWTLRKPFKLQELLETIERLC